MLAAELAGVAGGHGGCTVSRSGVAKLGNGACEEAEEVFIGDGRGEVGTALGPVPALQHKTLSMPIPTRQITIIHGWSACLWTICLDW